MAIYNGNFYLNQKQMSANAQYILSYLLARGWTKNAICGMLGNMQRESTINPGIWQNLDEGNTELGFGLVQWTPATKLQNWCIQHDLDYKKMDSQLKRILYEVDNVGVQWIATTDYPFSFKEFTTSTKSPSYLASAFLYNYERAGVSAEDERRENAAYWYNNLTGGSKYTPRLDSGGMEGSFYWYESNPFYIAGYGLPNCTTYAWGRFWEISDPEGTGANKPTLPTSDAGSWFNQVSGYETGNEPRLGAVICWAGDPGHVAIVEEIKDNGDIVISQSAWGGQYFWTDTAKKSNNYSLYGYTFQGFIYNPYAGTGEIVDDKPTKAKKPKRYKFVLFKKKRRVF